jgi:ATP-dependent protease HslVU (ClpYQ) peptidase subunit
VPLAFAPGSAILPAADLAPIKTITASRGNANILAGGFGGSFALALARAQRLGEALTAAGVPANAIKLVAQPSGSGGFVQLVY